jgi:two-component system, NtrC family, response regulator AtoC
MNTQEMNLFIVDGDHQMVNKLKQYLDKRFGRDLNISTFDNGESCLEKIDVDTKLVILSYFLKGKNGNDILKSIKDINPATEVIMHTSSHDVGIAIESFRGGARDFVIKGVKSKSKITFIVHQVITYPIRMMVREFGINKFLAMFLLTFTSMALAVYVILKYLHKF